MRADEEFVKDAIVRTLPKHPATVRPGGNDPPDFTLFFGSTAVALEVTALTSVYRNGDGTFGNQQTVSEALHRIHEGLRKEYSPRVRESCFLVIDYEGPIARPSEYRRQMRALLDKRLAADGFSDSDFETFDIAGERVRIRQHRAAQSHRSRDIVGIISNRNSIVNIARQAAILLNNAMARKSCIMSRICFDGDKWLGLLNSYFLADASTYRRALAEIGRTSVFSKVYLVSLDGAVEDLLQQQVKHPQARHEEVPDSVMPRWKESP